MGTSGSYGGPGGATPLVPTWVDDLPGPSLPVASPTATPNRAPTQTNKPTSPPQAPPPRPALLPSPVSDRFSVPRGNFSRFAGGGGTGAARSLKRAVSRYVKSGTGGSRTAARRMGASRAAGAGLLGFLTAAQAGRSSEALRELKLDALVGRPIQEVFLGLADYICPSGGTVDEGIAREAWIETVVDLANLGITDINTLTSDQVQLIFEHYAAHSIEARILNDIGSGLVTVPTDAAAARAVERQLWDFVRRSVADALGDARATIGALTPARIQEFVRGVYEDAFAILQVLDKEDE
jgi:hypothetical protein